MKIDIEFFSKKMKEIDSNTPEMDEAEVGTEGFSYKNKSLTQELKLIFRILRKKYSAYARKRSQKEFINILFLTLDSPLYSYEYRKTHSPMDFISELRKQYPELNIQVLIPIIGLDRNSFNPKKLKLEVNGSLIELEQKNHSVEFSCGKENVEAYLYKFPKNDSNIETYGIYSKAFSFLKSYEEIKKAENIIFFLRAARLIIKYLKKCGFKPDIIHSDKIPFFMGTEFEKEEKKQYSNIKIFQTIEDFTTEDLYKQEPIIGLLNIISKKEIKRLCKDKVIKKCLAEIFKINPINISDDTEDCLYLIKKNYVSFKFANGIEEIEQKELNNKIIQFLNKRITKLYPKLFNDGFYYPIISSLENSDFYGIESKTYYNSLFEKFEAPEAIKRTLIKTVDKACHISTGINLNAFSPENSKNAYYKFNTENFRTERIKNKNSLLKEFSFDRINTNFIDTTLFKDENFKIYGYLDSFYKAPLLFANPEPKIFEYGIDIILGTITKLLERNKNFQLILCIKDGLKQSPIKTTIDFILKQNVAQGRIVFIDGEIIPEKFMSGADFNIIADRVNTGSLNHLSGMHLGCIPVVSKSGTLNDTVINIFDDILAGNGFKTTESLLREDANSQLFYETLIKALDFYRDNPSAWNRIIKNAMNHDSGWTFKKLEKFNKIYQEII